MTTVVAWLAFAVSILSLGWQILAWSKSGPKTIVRSALGLLWPWPEHLGDANGPVEEAGRRLVVIVANVGRQSTTLHEVGVRLPGRSQSRSQAMPPVNFRRNHETAPLPVRLEPGDEYVERFEFDLLADLFGEECEPSSLVPMARVGHRWISGDHTKQVHVSFE